MIQEGFLSHIVVTDDHMINPLTDLIRPHRRQTVSSCRRSGPGSGISGGDGDGLNSIGNDESTSTVPTDTSTSNGSGLTRGCFSSGVRQREQIGIAPLGG